MTQHQILWAGREAYLRLTRIHAAPGAPSRVSNASSVLLWWWKRATTRVLCLMKNVLLRQNEFAHISIFDEFFKLFRASSIFQSWIVRTSGGTVGRESVGKGPWHSVLPAADNIQPLNY